MANSSGFNSSSGENGGFLIPNYMVAVLKIAGIPDTNGDIFSLDALQEIANSDPIHYWMDGNKLMGKLEVRSISNG